MIPEIRARGHVPIVAGGTGFYLHALAYDAEFSPEETGGTLRRELEERGTTEEGRNGLYEELSRVDPVGARQIHPHNSKRVIRALEYFYQNGEPISTHNARLRQKESPYALHYYVLTRPREELYRRIDRRVEEMLEKGLVQEVQHLLEEGCSRDMVSMQGLGYKEMIAYLAGEMDLAEATRVLQRDTRHFAKRQLTWFRREEARWLVWQEGESLSDQWEKIQSSFDENTPCN